MKIARHARSHPDGPHSGSPGLGSTHGRRPFAFLSHPLSPLVSALVSALVFASLIGPSAWSAVPALGAGVASATAEPTRPQGPAIDAGPAAAAGPDRPPRGWSYRRVAGGVELTYAAPRPIPPTDAGARVFADGRDLGSPSVRGDVATIVVPRLPADLGSLTLRVGGGPVDALLDAVDAGTAREAAGAGLRAIPAPATAVVPASLTPRRPERITAVDYQLPPLTDPRVSAPLRVLARVIAPSAPRPERPLVLFAHGRHGTCYRGGEVSGAYPCPKGWRALPSLLGYEYAQRLLAGQGFVTVSIDLNGVNGQDDVLDDGGAGLRATLIRHHLSALTAWSDEPDQAPFAKRLSLRFDPRSILLVGHSRGGEGAERAAAQAEADDPYAVAGLLLVAPTDFARQTVPNVPTTVVLPGCDGDVSDLQGQLYIDRALDAGSPTALHTAVYVPGSNHNAYNSEWTPGTARAPAFDDGEMSACAPATKLDPRSVRSAGATYALATAFAYLARQDRGIRLLDGRVATPAGSAVRGLLVTPVGGPRRLLWRGNLPGTPAATVVGGRLCHSLSSRADACASGDEFSGPHWLAVDDRVPRSARLALPTRDASGGLRFTDPADLERADWLDLRVVVPPRAAGRLAVRLEDASGHSMLVNPAVGASVHGLPAVLPKPGRPGSSGRWWAQLVRLPLGAARTAGVDLHRLRTLSLVATGGALSGAVLLDVSAGRPGLGDADPAPLPRLDQAQPDRVVPEGSTDRTVTVPFRPNRPASTDIDVVAAVTGVEGSPEGAADGMPTLHRVRMPAGSTRVDIPVRVTGNRVDDPDRTVIVAVEVNGQAVTGDWIAMLTVRDDDPAPRLTITPSAMAREGRTLVWVARLDRPSGQDVALDVSAVPVRRELTVADLTPAARTAWNVTGPAARPLSRTGASSYLVIASGKTSVNIAMSIARDGRREGAEYVRLRVNPARAASSRPLTLSGTVTD